MADDPIFAPPMPDDADQYPVNPIIKAAIHGLFSGAKDVGAAMPEAYGANAPIMDPLANAVIGAGKSAKDFVTGPGDLIKPNPYPPGSESAVWYEDQRNKDMVDWSRNAALQMAGMGAPAAEANAAGVFGGKLAKTADLGALKTAEKMADQGAAPADIHQATGWFQGADKQWRFEIPDTNARMNPNFYPNGEIPDGQFGKLAGQVWHPELYKAYPDLRNATAFVEKSQMPSGAYRKPDLSRSGEETINISAPTSAQARSTALHELQHAVQEREGFAPGGNPGMFSQADDAKLARDAISYRRELTDLDPHLTPKQKDDIVTKRYKDINAEEFLPGQEAKDIAHDVEGNPESTLKRVVQLYGLDQRTTPYTPMQLYRELPGEIEARNVQARADLTPEQLKITPPWQTQDMQPRPIVRDTFGGPNIFAKDKSALSLPGAAPADPSQTWWHGSASGDLRGGASGLHVGTKDAATQALEARIGTPASGNGWTGGDTYGNTLLAGRDTLTKLDPKGHNITGFRASENYPKDDFYAADYFRDNPGEWPKYPDGSQMPLEVTPNVVPYRIKGSMNNTTANPYADFKANGYMRAAKKRGNAKNGYFYRNDGEDAGSISAVVPSGEYLEPIFADKNKN